MRTLRLVIAAAVVAAVSALGANAAQAEAAPSRGSVVQPAGWQW